METNIHFIGVDDYIEIDNESLRIFKIVSKIKQDLFRFIPVVEELITSAKPFLSNEIVDETTGTIPLIERLESAIKDIENFIKQDLEV